MGISVISVSAQDRQAVRRQITQKIWRKHPTNCPTAGIAGYGNAEVMKDATNKDQIYIINPAIAGKFYSYDPLLDVWTQRADPPTIRTGAAVAFDKVRNRIYCIGGHGVAANTTINTNEEYNPTTNSWIARAVMTTARTLAQGIYGYQTGHIYVMGGHNNATTPVALTTNESYDPVGNLWVSRAAMTQARWMHMLTRGEGATYQDFIWAMGGYNGSAYQNTNYRYQQSTNTWVTKQAITQSAAATLWANGTTIFKDNKIYVFGGYNGTGSANSNKMFYYDVVLETWTDLITPSLISGSHNVCFFPGDGLFYFFNPSSAAMYTYKLEDDDAYTAGNKRVTVLASYPEPVMFQNFFPLPAVGGQRSLRIDGQYDTNGNPITDAYTSGSRTSNNTSASVTQWCCAPFNIMVDQSPWSQNTDQVIFALY